MRVPASRAAAQSVGFVVVGIVSPTESRKRRYRSVRRGAKRRDTTRHDTIRYDTIHTHIFARAHTHGRRSRACCIAIEVSILERLVNTWGPTRRPLLALQQTAAAVAVVEEEEAEEEEEAAAAAAVATATADTNNAVTRTWRGPSPSWSTSQDVQARGEARAGFNYRAAERAAIQGYA